MTDREPMVKKGDRYPVPCGTDKIGADYLNLDSKQDALGYTAEDSANKENTTIDTSTTKYPTVGLLKTGLDAKQNTLIFSGDGQNIKTINGNSLSGSGDLTITASINFETTDTEIKMNGTQSAGSGTTVPHANHVHPSDTSKQDALASGTNIKTINGSSVLGSGDLIVTSSVTDGDKGDIVVSGTGSVWTIDNSVVTEAKQLLADNTTNDVSTSAHGYCPKAPNDATKFLRGDATWANAGCIPEEVAYITLSGNQTTNLIATNHVELDTIVYPVEQAEHLITLATGTGQADGIITLTAGKLYRISGGTFSAHSSGAAFNTRLYNRTASAYIGLLWYGNQTGSNSTSSVCRIMPFYFTPAVDTDIDLRIYTSMNTTAIYSSSPYPTVLLIECLGGV